jgi:hypothetical protein
MPTLCPLPYGYYMSFSVAQGYLHRDKKEQKLHYGKSRPTLRQAPFSPRNSPSFPKPIK